MSTSKVVFDDERKEMFFFFRSVDFGEFSKSRVAQKKRRRIKSSCARCFEAAKLFLIDELKLEQFFLFLSVGVLDEDYSQSSKLSSSSDIFTRR